MKKLLLIILPFSFIGLAFATPVPPVEGYEWLPAIIATIKSIPSVGPYLVKAFDILATVTIACTAMVAFAETLFGIPIVLSKWKGSGELAEKVKTFKEKYLPWFRYFSSFNQQKKDKK